MKQDDILVQRKSISAENDGTEGWEILHHSIALSASVRLSCREIFCVTPFLLLDLSHFTVKTFPVKQGEIKTIINTLHGKSISPSFPFLEATARSFKSLFHHTHNTGKP